MKEIEVTFHSTKDFQNRIAQLWQSQKEDETFYFKFTCSETEKEFEKFISIFNENTSE